MIFYNKQEIIWNILILLMILIVIFKLLKQHLNLVGVILVKIEDLEVVLILEIIQLVVVINACQEIYFLHKIFVSILNCVFDQMDRKYYMNKFIHIKIICNVMHLQILYNLLEIYFHLHLLVINFVLDKM